MVDRQDAIKIVSLGVVREPVVTDRVAASILSHWCQTVGTVLAKERLAALEMVCHQLRTKLAADQESSSQILVLLLEGPSQVEGHTREQAKQETVVVNECIVQGSARESPKFCAPKSPRNQVTPPGD